MEQRSTDRLGPTEVVSRLLAMSVVEHTNARGLTIRVELDGPRATITDNGRGMKISPDDGESISHAEKALTTTFPVEASDPVVERVLRDLVWGQEGCDGPAEANAACRELELVSRRGGEIWSQRYANGTPTGAARRVGATADTGTTLRVDTGGPIDAAAIRTLVARLRADVEGLDLSVTTVA